MAVNYRAVPKKNPAKPADPAKFYAQAVSRGELTTRELSQLIAKMSTVSAPDVTAVIDNLLEFIPTELGKGMIVRLGDFGSFSITLSSEGTETADQLGSTNIKKMNVNFRPGRYFTDILNTTQFEKVG